MRTEQGRRDWVILNPLPRALAHYERALRAEVGGVLAAAPAVRPDIEVGGHGLPVKLLRALSAALALVRSARRGGPHLVVWPVAGLVDLAVWRIIGRDRCLVIVHDPEPLRRQHGYGRVGTLLGRWGSRGSRVEVVTHTELAAGSLRARGVSVTHVLPHPLLPGRLRRPALPTDAPVVLVLGQFKAARDVRLLEELGGAAPGEWDLRVRGRGWPRIPGWDVIDAFLTEQGIEAELDVADVVLVPYRTYFQSGIAARAFERGIPVVARPHEHLGAMYGPQWPGFFDGGSPGEVMAAVTRVAGTPPPAVAGDGGPCWRAALEG